MPTTLPSAPPRPPRVTRAPRPLAALVDRAVGAALAGAGAALAAPSGPPPMPRPGPVPPADHATLDRLAVPRERALALARAGKGEAAEAAMKGARSVLAFARLSPEGAAYAATMHEAAESYLSYRGGDYADAAARMEAALGATERLAEAWGEIAFVTCRRIDLAHNLMRVDARRGAARKAMRTGARLLESLADLTAADASPEPGVDAVAGRLAELVAATMAELLAPLSPAEARELVAPVASRAAPEGYSSDRARAWVALKAAALADDARPFLRGAAPFLRSGRDRAAPLWYGVALDLLRVARQLPGEAPRAGAEELSGLLAADPRAPGWIREGAAA